MPASVQIKGVAILILVVIAGGIWFAAIREDRRGVLTVSFFDANTIFIDSPSGRQVLINAGADASILRQLSAVMPWYDRSIDVVVASDFLPTDIGGFPDMLSRYKAATIIQSNAENTAYEFEKAVAAQTSAGTKLVTAKRGQIVDLGKGAYIEILFPDRLDPGMGSDATIVARLVYGDTAFLLAGNATQSLQNYLAALDTNSLRSDVVQVSDPSQILLGYSAPTFAVYSPSCVKKPVDTSAAVTAFARFNIQTLAVCTAGTVTFVSDGQTVTRE